MGCANSMPLMNGSSGIVETAKTAVSDTMHAGEEALHDVGDNINVAAVTVKEAVIGAVKSIGNGVDGLAKDAHAVEHKVEETLKTNHMEHANIQNDENGEPLYRTIPLKDPNSHTVDDDLEEFKDMLSQMSEDHSPSKEITKAAMNVEDDLDKFEEEMNNKIVETTHEITEMGMIDKTPTHSLDSLRTSTPEPEIINAILNDAYKSAPSPKPTLTEMKSIEAIDEVMVREKV